jgi:hypothetical protein
MELKFNPLQELKKVFKTEDSRFLLFTGLKVSGISFVINIVVYTYLFQVMRLNYAFFKSQGNVAGLEDESIFYNYLITEAAGNLTMFLAFHIILFFIGTYVGWLILRPFRIIGEYCEEVIENPDAIYKVDEFSTYKLLTRFSEFFFEYLRETRRKGEIITNSIPPQFSRIHKPVADRIFMLHFGLLLIIVAISSNVFIIENADAIYEAMVELATKTLKDQNTANRFFSNQLFIMGDLTTFTIVLFTFSYFALGFHLYEKVSGAAFGIFSTMRSFMKGNYFSRVHLVGYAYIRDYTRKLNKYLDYIQNNFEKEKPKG